jgi:UDP-N-acetylmuramoyl-tripeptide--D-alanyl-D-alanine ligase
VITNIGWCHLENLKTRDGILKAKTEIFKSMNPDGTVILNGDDDKLITIKDVYDKKPVFFGIENKSGIYAENIVNRSLCRHKLFAYGARARQKLSESGCKL